MSLEQFSKESKNVASPVEYNPTTKELFVRFKSFKDPKVTTPYVYKNVPADLWEALKKAESLGSFINKNVAKGGYEYEKLG